MAEEPFDWSTWPGVEDPTTTQFPDPLLDVVMAHVSPAEWKVLCYIVRRTYGFGKRDGDRISLRQMADGIVTRDGRRLDWGTGLSHFGVRKCLASLEEKGLVVVTKGKTEDGDNDVSFYSLRRRGEQQGCPPWATELPNKRQSSNRQKATDRVPAAASAMPRPSATQDTSDSDSLRAWAETTATALGRPGEAKQLATWARKLEIPGEVLQAAADVTQQQADLQKPVAYLQTVAKVMLADRQAAAEVGKRKQADTRKAALAYGREVHADRVIGGSWASVESIVGESYGAALAGEVVATLQAGAPLGS